MKYCKDCKKEIQQKYIRCQPCNIMKNIEILLINKLNDNYPFNDYNYKECLTALQTIRQNN